MNQYELVANLSRYESAVIVSSASPSPFWRVRFNVTIFGILPDCALFGFLLSLSYKKESIVFVDEILPALENPIENDSSYKNKKSIKKKIPTDRDNHKVENLDELKKKLKPLKVEKKSFEATKLNVEDVKEEKPQFATIKLRKPSLVPKKEVESVELSKRRLLKSRITRITDYPVPVQHAKIDFLPPVLRDCGELSRNYEEALKVVKKQIKKIKLPKLEKVKLEQYEPFVEENAEPTETPDETNEYQKGELSKMPSDEIPVKTLAMGKGKVPETEESIESVKLKKVPEKPEEEHDIDDKKKPKSPSDKEQPDKEKRKSEDTLRPLDDFPTDDVDLKFKKPKPTSTDSDEDVDEPKDTPRIKKKKEKPFIDEEDKKIVLGKPKKKPEDIEGDIKLKKKQGDLPTSEPEEKETRGH
uniref:Uncharacterized protein n=1 Tax=Cacopsylla melanoneura TaxID=428564 RepID=A0A8D8LTN7_9HEMI